MQRETAVGRRSGPARHERPDIDEAALRAARAADRVLDAARAAGSQRWTEYFATIPDLLAGPPPAPVPSPEEVAEFEAEGGSTPPPPTDQLDMFG